MRTFLMVRKTFVAVLLVSSVFRTPVQAGIGRGLSGADFAGTEGPLTVLYNPAGLTLSPYTTFVLASGLAFGKTKFEPVNDVSAPAEGYLTEYGALRLASIPIFGMSSRLAKPGGIGALPVAFGLTFSPTHGGGLSFDDRVVRPGTYHLDNMLLEVTPSVAYMVNSKLSFGMGVRIGFGFFNFETNAIVTADDAPAKVSGFGATGGVILGATWQALDWLRVGLTYASPMTVKMEGEGEVEIQPGTFRPDSVSFTVPWPQWVAVGLNIKATRTLQFAAGFRWMDWSTFDELVVDFSVIKNSIDNINLNDGFSAHLGMKWIFLPPLLTLRTAVSYDSNTLPDAGMERHIFDMPKVNGEVGLFSFIPWVPGMGIDVGYAFIANIPRTVNSYTRLAPADFDGRLEEQKVTPGPGKYSGIHHIITFALVYGF